MVAFETTTGIFMGSSSHFPWASILQGDSGFFTIESFKPEPRRQKNRQNPWFPGISEGPCLKSSSRPLGHRDLIPLLKITPERRTRTGGSGRCSCSGQLIGNGFPLGWLRAAQSLSLSVICLPRGPAFPQLVLGL